MDADDRRAIAGELSERAEAALADVHEAFDDAPRRDPLPFSRDHDPDDFPQSVAEQHERIAGIAGALVTDDEGQVLCVDVGYNDVDWQTPGGAVEPGDSLVETAHKEVREETGIEVELTGLLYTRLVECDYGEEEVATVPMAVFIAREVGGSVRVPDRTIPDGRDEIADVRWYEPGELPEGALDREWIVEHCAGD